MIFIGIQIDNTAIVNKTKTNEGIKISKNIKNGVMKDIPTITNINNNIFFIFIIPPCPNNHYNNNHYF